MKYDSGEDYGDGKKWYRDCVLLDLNTLLIDAGNEDDIIDIDNLPPNTIICDEGIADIVYLLNRKGYKTIFSCEGHLDVDVNEAHNNSATAMYVVFEVGNIDRYYKHLFNLPRNFKFDVYNPIKDFKEEVEEVYKKPKFNEEPHINRMIAIYSNCAFFEMDEESIDSPELVKNYEFYKMKDHFTLLRWVEGLPDLTVEESKVLYDERIIDRETARQFGFDFESIQDFKKDIRASYRLLSDTMRDMNKSMTEIIDIYRYISIRFKDIKIVDDIRNADGSEIIDYSKVSPFEMIKIFNESSEDRSSIYPNLFGTHEMKPPKEKNK